MTALLALLLAGAASSATAQHSGHAAPAASAAPATASCTPEHAALGHCTLPEPPPPPAASSSCTAEHAAMGHCTLPKPPPPPPPAASSTCLPEHAAMGHCTLPPGAPPAGGEATASLAVPPVGPPPPEALQGPANAAELYWDRASLARSRETLRREHGGMQVAKFLIDRAEARLGDGRDGYVVDGEAWYGGDQDKAWFKSEIEGEFGANPEQAEFQALWSHAIDPWFDVQAGVRYDAAPGRDTAHLVLGVQGLAPYWIEIDAAAFVSTRGDITARFEAEHDVRITQRLILQPRAELDFALQDIRRAAIGGGLSTAALGLRLRYQLSQNIGPYVGVEYDRAFAGTRKFRRREGDDLGGLSFVTGIRLWF